MTLVMSKTEKGHFIAHDDQNKILSYVSEQANFAWELELATFKPKVRSRVHLRNNLIDTGLVICSPCYLRCSLFGFDQKTVIVSNLWPYYFCSTVTKGSVPVI